VKRARFIAAARLEFLKEVIYYNEAEPGLGERFTAAVEEAIVRALAFPMAGSCRKYPPRYRQRFPVFARLSAGTGGIHRVCASPSFTGTRLLARPYAC
jgi:hypothetical protein